MVQINWNLATGPGGFQNALAQGYEIGSAMRQRQEEKEHKNALAAYATDPNEQNFAGLAQAAPEFAMRERQAMDQRQAQEAQRRQQQMGTVRQLLAKASQSPEGWQQAMGAAQSLGIDTSALPQQYDPAWAQQQLFIMDALEKDQDAIPGIAREVMFALGTNDANDPRVQAGVREVLNNKYASDYVDAQGNTRRRTTLDIGGGQGGPQPGAVEDGYRFKGGNPSDPNSWEPVEPTIQNTPAPQVGANGMPTMLSRQQYQATVASMGKAATDAWMQRNNVRVGN